MIRCLFVILECQVLYFELLSRKFCDKNFVTIVKFVKTMKIFDHRNFTAKLNLECVYIVNTIVNTYVCPHAARCLSIYHFTYKSNQPAGTTSGNRFQCMNS